MNKRYRSSVHAHNSREFLERRFEIRDTGLPTGFFILRLRADVERRSPVQNRVGHSSRSIAEIPVQNDNRKRSGGFKDRLRRYLLITRRSLVLTITPFFRVQPSTTVAVSSDKTVSPPYALPSTMVSFKPSITRIPYFGRVPFPRPFRAPRADRVGPSHV